MAFSSVGNLLKEKIMKKNLLYFLVSMFTFILFFFFAEYCYDYFFPEFEEKGVVEDYSAILIGVLGAISSLVTAIASLVKAIKEK